MHQKHLHVRGEDEICEDDIFNKLETPPRAWRRRKIKPSKNITSRNTSTCVEKTRRRRCAFDTQGKHLHVRGEDKLRETSKTESIETPPRAWRRRVKMKGVNVMVRNTSTCVEKTICFRSAGLFTMKHLHVRGEDSSADTSGGMLAETPPRAWRRRHGPDRLLDLARNTSTCVEKTPCLLHGQRRSQKHLHVRGEDYAQEGSF